MRGKKKGKRLPGLDAPSPVGEEDARIDAQDPDLIEQQEGPLERRTSVEKMNRMNSPRTATKSPEPPGA